jgi:hypothetical protein
VNTLFAAVAAPSNNAVHRRINLLVDVYPQVVDPDVDNFGVHVNDKYESAAVHVCDTVLWPTSSRRPHANRPSRLGRVRLSPESTDAMTIDEDCYLRMANCTTFTGARSVDTRFMTTKESR